MSDKLRKELQEVILREMPTDKGLEINLHVRMKFDWKLEKHKIEVVSSTIEYVGKEETE